MDPYCIKVKLTLKSGDEMAVFAIDGDKVLIVKYKVSGTIASNIVST